ALPAEHLRLGAAAAGALGGRGDGLGGGGLHRRQGVPHRGFRVVGQSGLPARPPLLKLSEAFVVINFRYHVVSLTAVFLALAIGLVVGTAALNGPVADSLKDQVSALSKDNSNFRDQANQYREELNRAQDFATEVAPALLNGKLTGRKLLLVGLPGSQDYVNLVRSMLTVAGATITAKVTVQDKFFDPA